MRNIITTLVPLSMIFGLQELIDMVAMTAIVSFIFWTRFVALLVPS